MHSYPQLAACCALAPRNLTHWQAWAIPPCAPSSGVRSNSSLANPRHPPPAAAAAAAPETQGLGRLWAAWAASLEDVRLVDLSVAELDPCATLPTLRACGVLTSLRLLLREPMAPEVAVVDVGALPPRLEQLALRHVVVTACAATQRRCVAIAWMCMYACVCLWMCVWLCACVHEGSCMCVLCMQLGASTCR